MSDHDMNIFNNPDLGENGTSPFLDEIEAQTQENRNAELENRLPRRVIPRQRFGPYANSHIVGPLVFSDAVSDAPEVITEEIEEFEEEFNLDVDIDGDE